MRIWSIHPEYLDSKGLVALWRETLLAKNVLEGKTRAYKNHPQLHRFKQANNPVDRINQYLSHVHKEAEARGYNFDRSKIEWDFNPGSLTVTSGQLKYEITHLINKLKLRNPERYKKLIHETNFNPHPLFSLVEGGLEDWEIVTNI